MPVSTANLPVRPVYVSGHRNPDTDSIASAVGYAELKAALDPDTEYVPVRLGELNPQTEWALERCGAATPRLLPHIMLRAREVVRERFPVIGADDPVRTAGRVLFEEGLDVVPVVDGDGALLGVLTERALARRYIRESYEASRLEAPTAVRAMARVLDGRLAADSDLRVAGRVWVLANDIDSMLSDVIEGDIAVAGNRPDVHLKAIEHGVSVLVLSNGSTAGDDVVALAASRGTAIIVTPLDSYVAARMVTLSSPCLALIDRDPLTVRPNDLVSDIADDVKDVSYRAAIVVDADRCPVGLVTRADLVSPRPRRVILVDHAELGQSVPGVEQAEIVEILDHHHVGSIETTHPVMATFDPVGSTSTLVAERFVAAGVRPRTETAMLLLAAILSDTVILNSPTTTDRDARVVAHLGELLSIDPLAFGREMYESASDVSRVSAEDLVSRDAKAYELSSGDTICIAQVETVGHALNGRLPELQASLTASCARDGHLLMALMVTDVLARVTHLLVAGDLATAERAFGATSADGVIELPGVMSRKKQVAPALLASAQ